MADAREHIPHVPVVIDGMGVPLGRAAAGLAVVVEFTYRSTAIIIMMRITIAIIIVVVVVVVVVVLCACRGFQHPKCDNDRHPEAYKSI